MWFHIFNQSIYLQHFFFMKHFKLWQAQLWKLSNCYLCTWHRCCSVPVESRSLAPEGRGIKYITLTLIKCFFPRSSPGVGGPWFQLTDEKTWNCILQHCEHQQRKHEPRMGAELLTCSQPYCESGVTQTTLSNSVSADWSKRRSGLLLSQKP